MHPKIKMGRLSGRIKTAERIADFLAPKTNPEATPPNKVMPNIPSRSDNESSKKIVEVIPIIAHIAGNTIIKGSVVTKKKQKHFAAA